ncbi:type I polyketide synthase, partial [Streptomyces sp. S1]|uniref:type I polyketide synthase n=1 Tax=Streptomyces sp. S1 TaxID=718288 RepID=UPI003D727E0C
HAQAAAGVGGVIKMVQAMRHGILPKTLHVDEPTPMVDWTTGAVELLTEQREWPDTGRARRAAVSSFGFGGTNAHVVLEQAPAEPPADRAPAATTPVVTPWLLSAKSEQALQSQAARLDDFLTRNPTLSPAEIAWSLATTRTTHSHRAVILGTNIEELQGRVRALAEGQTGPDVVTGAATPGKTAFLFTGQGAQRVGMGMELYDTFPVFAEAFDEACAALDPHLDQSIAHTIRTGQHLDQTVYTQPALFAVEVALYRLVESFGLRPDFVAGHSIGEITAAHIAGVFDLPDAARLVTTRARLMQNATPGGTMIAIQADEEEILPTLAGHEEHVSIAALNSPHSTVISGDTHAVEEISGLWKQRGRKTTRLTVSHAFHSPHMNQAAEEFRTAAASVTYHPPTIPLVSTLTGQLVDSELTTPDYWADQLRGTVRFTHALNTLNDQGTTTYLEIGPNAVLTPLTPDQAHTTPLLRAGKPEVSTLLTALATTHTRTTLNWTPLLTPSNTTDLPTYAFQRERYWLMPEAGEVSAPAADELFAVEWQETSAHVDEARSRRWGVLGEGNEAVLDGGTVEVFDGLGAVAEAAGRLDAVLLPWSQDTQARPPASAHEAHEATERVLDLLQRWLADERLLGLPLVVLTRGAVRAAPEDVPDPVASAVWGLLRSVQTEHPGRVVLVDADGTVPASVLSSVLAGSAPESVLRSGVPMTPRLRALPVAARRPDAPRWSSSGTVLVTGGTGLLGAAVSRHLVAEHGVTNLLLLGLHGEQAYGASELAAELKELGAEVTIAACDVADRDALDDLLSGLSGERRLTGVVHAAGVLDNGLFESLEPERLHAVLRPKVDGAWNLHELTRDLDLTAFVTFSSTVGVFGAPGQSNYAAANAFLDGLAHHRRARGLPATSIAWGLWEEGGINGRLDEKDRERFARSGFGVTSRSRGIALFDRAVGSGVPAVVATPLDRTEIRSGGQVPHLLRTVVPGGPEGHAVESPAGAGAAQSPADRLASLSPREREEWALSLVRTEAASVLGHASPLAVTPESSFQDLGLDSMTGVELRNRLNTATGVRLAATVVFDHPTPEALAGHLLERLGPVAGDTVSSVLADLDAGLDKVDALLAAAPPREAEREELAARLQALVGRLKKPEPAPQAQEEDDALASASAEELFSFIDSRLS